MTIYTCKGCGCAFSSTSNLEDDPHCFGCTLKETQRQLLTRHETEMRAEYPFFVGLGMLFITLLFIVLRFLSCNQNSIQIN